MKKRGMELSINFLIAVILAIVIFGFGIYFANMLFGAAEEKQEEVSAQVKEQITGLLHSGEKVAIPVTRLKINPGQSDVFGIGILNVDDTNNKFYVTIDVGPAYDKDGNEIFAGKLNQDRDLLFRVRSGEPVTIGVNKEEIFSVGISVPSGIASGTHILNVYVCLDNANNFNPTLEECSGNLDPLKLYDNSVHKVYVEVP